MTDIQIKRLKSANSIVWLMSWIVLIVCVFAALEAYIKYDTCFPMHFNLEGEHSSEAPKWVVWLYPAAILCLRWIDILFPRRARKPLEGMKVLRSSYSSCAILAAALVIFCSLMVGVSGGEHFYMFSEPVLVVLLAAHIVGCEIRIKKASEN